MQLEMIINDDADQEESYRLYHFSRWPSQPVLGRECWTSLMKNSFSRLLRLKSRYSEADVFSIKFYLI